jgi:hypothetical protein
MLDQRQRLRVVHDDKIVVEKIPHAVLVNHLLEDFLFDSRKIDFSTLKCIVHFLGDREKIGCPLDNAPFSTQTEAVHEQGERGDHLPHTIAVVG